jgi:hypothetical protein
MKFEKYDRMNRLRELGASQDLENHRMQKTLSQARNNKT